MTAAFVAE
jgi:hypothetical protein